MFGHPAPSIDSRKKKRLQNKRKPQLQLTMPAMLVRRCLYFLLVSASTIAGVIMMIEVFRGQGITALELALITLFALTFAWITTAFWNAVIGFALQLFRLDPLSLRSLSKLNATSSGTEKLRSLTAIVMPVYNEDPQRVMAGFEATLNSLFATGQLNHFDFYLLSDTQDETLKAQEQAAWLDLLERVPEHFSHHLFYRRRQDNKGRKVGNLTDFCQRWGAYYENMIVLDADSVMTGDCVISLVRHMEDNPRAGLIQTVPIPVRQKTFFGRFLQFSAELYSPMLATGMAFWQGDCANYWGHNAIIRIQAFVQHCGLPALPGRGPFSGEILSHDFVEAALLRRANWDVILLAHLPGSYEEVPSNIIDYATRDRRWVQGNMQHLALLKTSGLHGLSRLHMFFGAVAYLSTVVWLCMLVLSTADAVYRSLTSNVFFHSGYQLFPSWPVDKSFLIYSMLVVTGVLLLLPKLLAYCVALVHRRQAFGGVIKLTSGLVVETVFAILIAPLMMLFHSYFVMSVLVGKKVSWNAQGRDGRMVPWREALRRTWLPLALAAIWGSFTYFLTPVFFWWITPILLGLVLSAPLVRFSSSLTLGRWSRKLGVFISPSEVFDIHILADVIRIMKRQHSRDFENVLSLTASVGRRTGLPPEKWREMPIQDLHSPDFSNAS